MTDRRREAENANQTVAARIAERAEAIYKDRFKEAVEAEHDCGFVAIDVLAENHYFAETAEGALMTARERAPHGVFHLIRIGAADTASSRYGWGDETAASWAL